MSLRNFSRASLFVLACAGSGLALSAAACGSEADDGAGGAGAASSSGTPAGSGGSGATGGGPGSGGTGGDGAANPGCEEPGDHPGAGPTLAVDSVEATLEDTDGNPIADSQVQLCGINLCLYGDTDGTGHVTVPGGAEMLERPAFKYGDGTRHARFAVPVVEADTSLGTLVTVALPSEGVDLAIGTVVESGPVELDIAAGSGFVLDELTLDEPDELLFRAASMDPTLLPAGVGVPEGMVTVYGVAPLETIFCPPAQVTVTNETGLPADSAVEFWSHGVDVFELAAPYAGWRKVSDGTVSADGMTISTTAGQGIEVLTTFGIKPAE
ncbi:MAG: hypothetical protein WKG00_17190 [Polyangiaceae bacterium]